MKHKTDDNLSTEPSRLELCRSEEEEEEKTRSELTWNFPATDSWSLKLWNLELSGHGFEQTKGSEDFSTKVKDTKKSSPTYAEEEQVVCFRCLRLFRLLRADDDLGVTADRGGSAEASAIDVARA